MKLSFFSDGSLDCPLLMLSDICTEELAALREAARDLGAGNRDSAVVGAAADSVVSLTLRVADRDVGILKTPPAFECLLRPWRWSNIEGLIEPFRSDSSGFQWLDDSGEVALLLAPRGRW